MLYVHNRHGNFANTKTFFPPQFEKELRVTERSTSL